MIIYQDTTDNFIRSIRANKLSDVIRENFATYFTYSPSDSEYNSWTNSLSRVRDLIELAGLRDNHIVVEYEVPYNQSRIDCMIFGRDNTGKNNVVLLELKQWSKVDRTEDEGNFVETFVGGGIKVVPHPSQQVKGYHNYINSFVAEFETENPLILHSYAYCHNYKRKGNTGLYDERYRDLIREFPLFSAEDTEKLAGHIASLLQQGRGTELFNRFISSEIKPSRKLLENVTKVIKNESVFSLLDEQIVAKNMIWSQVRKNLKSGNKSVIIVHGGPGTGKSIIALNVLAQAAAKQLKVYWGCKSTPFRSGIQKLVGSRASILFSNLYSFVPSKKKEDQADLLLIDEAHRIEHSSNHQFMKAEDRTNMPQIDQLIRCARTSVFFIDDMQSVRRAEIGSSALIKESAGRYSASVSEVTLKNQFRCMGSNDYLLWLESMLGYSEQKRYFRKNSQFDFLIFDTPRELYDSLAEKEKEKPNSARLTAGFCWPWSNSLVDGEFVRDVAIGDFAMPWETHFDIRKPPPGYVQWFEWAYRTEGFRQVGCIYTAQGFEFDYVGVIVGEDMKYNLHTNQLEFDINKTKDPKLKQDAKNFPNYVRNIYRVLMTRGIKGCYIYFVDDDTREYFEAYLR